MTGRPKNNEAKFWKNVDAQNASHLDCWPWKGSLLNGYGNYSENFVRIYAHRYAWMSANRRSVPEGMQVMHLCNNKGCCNPLHLKAGSASENTIMAYRDGLALAGDRHPRTKLSSVQVQQIKSDPRKQVAIAADYGIRQTTVSRIKAGIIRKHDGVNTR